MTDKELSEYFAKMGKKGGNKLKSTVDPSYYSRIGKKGNRTMKKMRQRPLPIKRADESNLVFAKRARKEGFTYREIGEVLKLTRQRVQQILTKKIVEN